MRLPPDDRISAAAMAAACATDSSWNEYPETGWRMLSSNEAPRGEASVWFRPPNDVEATSSKRHHVL